MKQDSLISAINKNPEIVHSIDWREATHWFNESRIHEIILGINSDNVCNIVCDYIKSGWYEATAKKTKTNPLDPKQSLLKIEWGEEMYRFQPYEGEYILYKTGSCMQVESYIHGSLNVRKKEEAVRRKRIQHQEEQERKAIERTREARTEIELSTAMRKRETIMIEHEMAWNKIMEEKSQEGITNTEEDKSNTNKSEKIGNDVKLSDNKFQTKTTIKIAKRKKSSVVLILNAMYRAGWFVDKDENSLTNRDKALNEILMTAFGETKETAILPTLNPSGSFNNESRVDRITTNFNQFIEESLEDMRKDLEEILNKKGK